MLFPALAALFLVPAYYTAKAKGYRAGLLTVAAILVSLAWNLVSVLTLDTRYLPLVVVTPGAWLIVALLLPSRPGAVGRNFAFACPLCHETISLPRDRVGLTSLCPKCDDIITIPPEPGVEAVGAMEPVSAQGPNKPDAEGGLVVFRACDSEEEAELVSAMLLRHGVQAEILAEDSIRATPPITWPTWRVLIDIADWDRAAMIEGTREAPEGHS